MHFVALVSEKPVEFLDLSDVVLLAGLVLGNPPPIRDLGLLSSAVERPKTTLFGADAYPDLMTKAAALLHSIVKNHALVDGNKRLAWLATAVFLETNGVGVADISNNDVYRFVMRVAATDLTLGEITELLGELVVD